MCERKLKHWTYLHLKYLFVLCECEFAFEHLFAAVEDPTEQNSKTLCLPFPRDQDRWHISFVVFCYTYGISTALFSYLFPFSIKSPLSFSLFGAIILPHNFLLLSYLYNVENYWFCFKYCSKLIEFLFVLRIYRWFCGCIFFKSYNILVPCNSYEVGGGKERENEIPHVSCDDCLYFGILDLNKV